MCMLIPRAKAYITHMRPGCGHDTDMLACMPAERLAAWHDGAFLLVDAACEESHWRVRPSLVDAACEERLRACAETSIRGVQQESKRHHLMGSAQCTLREACQCKLSTHSWHLRHVCFHDMDMETEESPSTRRERMPHHSEQGYVLCKMHQEIVETNGKGRRFANSRGDMAASGAVCMAQSCCR
jgi:hypothetical protein